MDPLLDLHVHSTCSPDGASSIAEYIRRAAELGLCEIGFCEHADFDPRDRACGYLDPARFSREITEARAWAPAVRLRQGVEITYQAGLEAEIRRWLAEGAWDYVVVSVHLVDYADGWALVSERQAAEAYFATHAERQGYLPYFEELLCAVRSGLGDVLGHLDLIKRYGVETYGPFEPKAYAGEIRAVLRAMAERGMALEVNTSGLRQPPSEPYPGPTVLRWFREMGGEVVCVGSDAHHVGQLGAGITEALALVQAAGFRAVATFEERRAVLCSL